VKPLTWVLKNKIKVTLGKPICFKQYIDYSKVKTAPRIQRTSFLASKRKSPLVRGRDTVDARYPLKNFQNN
jgi:Fe-coproporphyrin III synthase